MSPQLHWSPTLLADIPFLTAPECAAVVRHLQTLRAHWEQRHPVAPFYTLGATNYYDLFNAPGLPYYDKAQRLNPLLCENFGWLYARLHEQLRATFGITTAFARRLAVPGFNIVQAHPLLQQTRILTVVEWSQKRAEADHFSLPAHVDTPQHVVDWSDYAQVDLEHLVSFTLPIAMPQSGAGLKIWELLDVETLGQDEPAIAAMLATRKTWVHPYQLGALTVHSGRYYHTGAPMLDSKPDDLRITLQGHATLTDGVAILYW